MFAMYAGVNTTPFHYVFQYCGEMSCYSFLVWCGLRQVTWPNISATVCTILIQYNPITLYFECPCVNYTVSFDTIYQSNLVFVLMCGWEYATTDIMKHKINIPEMRLFIEPPDEIKVSGFHACALMLGPCVTLCDPC